MTEKKSTVKSFRCTTLVETHQVYARTMRELLDHMAKLAKDSSVVQISAEFDETVDRPNMYRGLVTFE